MHLQELTDFKEQMMRLITSDNKLMKALVNLNTEDPLNSSLAKLNGAQHTTGWDYFDVVVFDYPWVGTDLETEQKAYITLDFMNTGLSGNTFKDISIAVYIWCHKNKLRMYDEKGLRKMSRVDYIAQRLEKMLNQSPNFGIGKLTFAGFKLDRLTPDIPGMCLVYATSSFDRPNAPSVIRTALKGD